MTVRERRFCALGFRLADVREDLSMVIVPTTQRVIVRTPNGWEVQPWGSDEWKPYTDLLTACWDATPPDQRQTPDWRH